MPQVGVGAAGDDVEIVTLDNSEIMLAVPEPPRKSPNDKKKKKTKESGAVGRRWPVGHSAEESRPCTDSGGRRRQRKAG
jgi:hypothetical protein